MNPSEDFVLSNIPGVREGISGSCYGMHNIGMNKYISEERKGKVVKVLEYITSFEFQSNHTIRFGLISPLDRAMMRHCEEYTQCHNFRHVQPLIRPIDLTDDYISYSRKFRNYILQYLYEGLDVNKCLENIKYITMTYVKTASDRILNGFYMILFDITVFVMFIFYCLAFTKRHRQKFKLLSKFYWFIYMFGNILIMCYGFMGMGELNDIKCQAKPLFFSFGFTLCNTILLIRLLINFPDNSFHFVRFCKNHFGLAVFISLGIDILLNGLVMINPYHAVRVVDGARLFNKCKITGTLGIGCMGLIYCYKFCILISMMVLVFIEWNMKEYRHDVHNATAILLISVITYLLIFLSNHVSSGGYAVEFLFPALIYYLYGFTSFAIFFISRFFTSYNSRNSAEEIIKKAVAHRPYSNSSKDRESSNSYGTSTSSNSDSNSPKKLSLTSRIINLRNNADEIKKNSEFSLKSSTTLSDKTKASLKTNSLSVDNIKNFDESISMSMTRRPSQITAIPENEIADSFCSNSDQDIHESMNFHRMRSVDNIMPSYNRTRMSSIPNKMYIGMRNMRSYDNFQNSNDNFVRKGSTRSVSNSNINPNINPNINTNTNT
eukprot:jgi/Orpsp1_1/1190806/evm.model.d7180000081318.1